MTTVQKVKSSLVDTLVIAALFLVAAHAHEIAALGGAG